MTPVEISIHLVKALCPDTDLRIEVDEPKDAKRGVWFVDFWLGSTRVILEWWEKTGYAVFAGGWPVYHREAERASAHVASVLRNIPEDHLPTVVLPAPDTSNVVTLTRGAYTLTLTPHRRSWEWELHIGRTLIGHGVKDSRQQAKRAGFRRFERFRHAA